MTTNEPTDKNRSKQLIGDSVTVGDCLEIAMPGGSSFWGVVTRHGAGVVVLDNPTGATLAIEEIPRSVVTVKEIPGGLMVEVPGLLKGRKT